MTAKRELLCVSSLMTDAILVACLSGGSIEQKDPNQLVRVFSGEGGI